MSFKVKTTPTFERDLKYLAKKYPSLKTEYIQLVNTLKQDPKQGINLGDNCYKIRISIASKGKGKSGGARVITHFLIEDALVYLLSIYDKSEKESISNKELKGLLKLISG